ncbi:hypothetical protein LCGC14_2343720, partial [marine sediment metagenome]
VYGEARSEDDEGRRAVAHVMLNRWRTTDGQFRRDDTVATVCLRHVQFSSWNTGDPNLAKMMEVDVNSDVFRQCLIAALIAIDEPDFTEGARHYHTKRSRPRWSRGHSPSYRHGAHVFFNDVR